MAIRNLLNLKRLLITLIIGGFTCILIYPKSGQAESCNAPVETIEKLFAPHLGTYSLWDLINGVPDMRQSFTDFIMVSDTDVILAGYQENNKIKRPIIRKMNRRGQVIWTWMDKTGMGLSRPITIKKLIDQGDKFIAAGQLYKGKTPHAIWLAKFDKNGKKLSEKIISRNGQNYTFADMQAGLGGKNWLLVLNEKQTSNTALSNSRFILLNSAFNLMNSRAFLPGPENRVHAVDTYKGPLSEDFYIAVGEIDDGAARKAGLVIRLDNNANITWQRTYPRGDGLRLKDVALSKNGDVLVTGEAKPLTPEAPIAGNVMKLSSSNGTELWQRYYSREDMAYKGKSIFTSPDGRAHVLLNGMDVTDSVLQSHARIITLSPRGEIMNDISYTAGKGTIPERIKTDDDGALLLSGMTTIEIPDPEDPSNKTKLSDQGWFLVGEKIGGYTDPCIIKEQAF